MRCTVERVESLDGSGTMRVSGDVDLAETGKLRHTVTTALTDPQLSELIVDLSAVTFLDCAGIGALLHGRRVAEANAKRYEVVGARDSVRRVLELTGVLPDLGYKPLDAMRRLVVCASHDASLSRPGKRPRVPP